MMKIIDEVKRPGVTYGTFRYTVCVTEQTLKSTPVIKCSLFATQLSCNHGSLLPVCLHFVCVMIHFVQIIQSFNLLH